VAVATSATKPLGHTVTIINKITQAMVKVLILRILIISQKQIISRLVSKEFVRIKVLKACTSSQPIKPVVVKKAVG
jgi:hypothetical protein